VPSAAALLLAASLLQVPFGSSFDVRLHGSPPAPAAGTVIGDLLLVAVRPSEEGDKIVTLRPLALGLLTVPLSGAQPSKVEVRPTLAPGAEPRALLVPDPASFPWMVVAAPFLAAAVVLLVVRLVRRRSRRDPLAELETALAPLALPLGWVGGGGPDTLARACRGFLRVVTGAPCEAMTTRELSRLLAARLDIGTAAPFALALVLADEARFARTAPQPEEAVTLVRDVLSAAPQILPAVEGRH
jgi:hypothetical protein